MKNNNSIFKRIFIGMTAAAIAASMTACGDISDSDSSSAAKPASSAADPEAESTQTENTPSEASDESTADVSSVSDNTSVSDDSSSSDDTSAPDKSEIYVNDNADINSAIVNFSVDIFRETTADAVRNGENVLVSPESIVLALGMLENGCAGDSFNELNRLLSDSAALDDFNSTASVLYKIADEKDRGVEFNVANSIWVRDSEKLTLNDNFVQRAEEFFNADIFRKPFDDTTLGEINGWVNDNTNGMIPEILNQLSPDDASVLINAIAFEGGWRKPYEDYEIDENGRFTTITGEAQDVTMLTRSDTGRYIRSSDAKGFIQSYEGGTYAFMAILPDEDISLADYVDSFTGEKFTELLNYNPGKPYVVDTQLPEFTFEYSSSLRNSLMAMGIEKVFDPDNADLSEMLTSSDSNIFVGDVIHKTYIKLDRNGTKAAAATAVISKATSAMSEEPVHYSVNLDRPFLYAIIDTEENVPVFIGAVNSIK